MCPTSIHFTKENYSPGPRRLSLGHAAKWLKNGGQDPGLSFSTLNHGQTLKTPKKHQKNIDAWDPFSLILRYLLLGVD